eukprot:Clim_evm24s166 gene=Clim_evmTU24s166
MSQKSNISRYYNRVHAGLKKYPRAGLSDLSATVSDQSPPAVQCLYIAKTVKYLFYQYAEDMMKRAHLEAEKIENISRTKQMKIWIQPLIRSLKLRTIDKGLRRGLLKFVKNVNDGAYTQAYDEYLALAIGKEPWPLGVSNVGIHTRYRSKEKLSQPSNALTDETKRKYLQALKRLLTYAENQSLS